MQICLHHRTRFVVSTVSVTTGQPSFLSFSPLGVNVDINCDDPLTEKIHQVASQLHSFLCF